MPKHRKDGNGTQKRKYENHFKKIEQFNKIKKAFLKSGKIFNQLLKTKEKYNISTHLIDLSHICNIQK